MSPLLNQVGGTVYFHGRAGCSSFLLDVHTGRTCFPLEGAEGQSSFAAWTQDGRTSLLFLDEENDERYQLIKTCSATGRILGSFRAKKDYFIRSAAAYSEESPCFIIANYDPSASAVIENNNLLEIAWTGGGMRSYPILGDAFDFTPRVSRDGRFLLLIKYERRDNSAECLVLNITTGEILSLNQPAAGEKITAYWRSEGLSVLLARFSKNGCSAEVVDLKTALRRQIHSISDFEAHDIFLLPDGKKAVMSKWEQGRLLTAILDTGSDSFCPILTDRAQALPIGETADGKIVARLSADDAVSNLVIAPGVDSVEEKGRRLFPKPSEHGLHHKFIQGLHASWRSLDGLAISGMLYRAEDWNGGAIVYLHGGPHSHVGQNLHPEIQFYAACGFNVLAVNYRGSSGFGGVFENKIRERGCGAGEADDVLTGIAWLRSKGLALAEKIAVNGLSYGGFLTWVCLTRTGKDMISAAVSISGMVDMFTDYESSRPEIRSFTEELMGGPPGKEPARYDTASPARKAHLISAPILIVHGLRDTNVDPGQIHELVSKLRTMGKPVETLLFEKEGHGINDPKSKAEMLRAIRSFLDRTFSVQSGSCGI